MRSHNFTRCSNGSGQNTRFTRFLIDTRSDSLQIEASKLSNSGVALGMASAKVTAGGKPTNRARVDLRTRTRQRRGEFLALYRPSDAYLQKPGRGTGVPGILEGTSADGNPVLIRVWSRGANVDDGELVDIWRNELRVLHRLGGSPGAEEYIGRLVDAGQDTRGFYIVIGAAQRRPLEIFLDPDRRGTEWLRSVAAPSRRRLLLGEPPPDRFGVGHPPQSRTSPLQSRCVVGADEWWL